MNTKCPYAMILAACLVCSCGGGGGGGEQTATPPTISTASATIGADGGTIQVSDASNTLNGLTVRIPRGALAATTAIAVEKGPAIASSSLSAEQFVLKLSPSGTTFATPIEISLPVSFTTSATAIGAYQTVNDEGDWEEVENRVYDAASKKVTLTVSHFSSVLIIPTKPSLPVPPAGIYTFSILTQDTSPNTAYTTSEAAAIEAAITTGPLQPFYGCTGGYGFTRVAYPLNGNPTSNIVVVKTNLPNTPQLSSFRWRSLFNQAQISSRVSELSSGTFIKLYSGAGTVPSDSYDLRTIVAHELSHFMSIPSQPPPYDSNGLFFQTLPKGISRGLTTTDKAGLVERFPRCDVPVVTLTAAPSPIAVSQDITVVWSIKNYADNCTASGDWIGSKPATGSTTVNSGTSASIKRFSLACTGPTGTGAATASVTVTASTCAQVAGTWTVSDTATITCSGSFGSGTDTQTATGSVSISQNGCNVSFLSPANTQRSGTVTANTIQLTGPLAIAGAGTTFTQNRIDFAGSISLDARTMNLTGNGTVAGSNQGTPGSCTANSTERFTR